ncbi:MAG: ATP-binding protein [Treponema sp.]|jgi:anti-sigma regulatory factor (Ser/Thr protein kinase)|nr:ATP-binding protein [Treponema sp.]
MHFDYEVSGDDFSRAGIASQDIKKRLQQLGVPVSTVKRTAIAMFEAEINMVIHAHGGQAHIDIGDDKITIVMEDHGPGIPDIELAMQPGYSTAPESARDLGWGAGMGLPNMKRNSDFMKIDSKVGEGTKVTMEIKIKNV